MGWMTRIAVSAAALAVAGCVATPSPQGAQAQFEGFTEDLALARLIDERCPSIRLRYSQDQLITAYRQQMLAAGYNQSDLFQALFRSSPDAVAVSALQRLRASGVQPGNAPQLCAYGLAEMAAGTRTGSFLR